MTGPVCRPKHPTVPSAEVRGTEVRGTEVRGNTSAYRLGNCDARFQSCLRGEFFAAAAVATAAGDSYSAVTLALLRPIGWALRNLPFDWAKKFAHEAYTIRAQGLEKKADYLGAAEAYGRMAELDRTSSRTEALHKRGELLEGYARSIRNGSRLSGRFKSSDERSMAANEALEEASQAFAQAGDLEAEVRVLESQVPFVDDKREAEIYVRIGGIFETRGQNFRRASFFYRFAANAYGRISKRAEEIQCREKQIYLLERLSPPKNHLELGEAYSRLAELYEESKKLKEAARAQQSAGDNWIEVKEEGASYINVAAKAYQKAAELQEKLGDFAAAGENRLREAHALLSTMDIDSVAIALGVAADDFKKANNPEKEAQALQSQRDLYVEMELHQRATDLDPRLAKAWETAGDLAIKNKRWSDAHQFLQAAMEVDRRKKTPDIQRANLFGKIAQVYHSQGFTELEAHSYYLQGDILKQIDEHEAAAEAFERSAILYREIKKWGDVALTRGREAAEWEVVADGWTIGGNKAHAALAYKAKGKALAAQAKALGMNGDVMASAAVRDEATRAFAQALRFEEMANVGKMTEKPKVAESSAGKGSLAVVNQGEAYIKFLASDISSETTGSLREFLRVGAEEFGKSEPDILEALTRGEGELYSQIQTFFGRDEKVLDSLSRRAREHDVDKDKRGKEVPSRDVRAAGK